MAAGVLDDSFGNGGLVTTDFAGGSDVANSLAIQPDGKLVLAGNASAGQDIALSRYLSDGTLDQGFGVGGLVTTNVGSSANASAVALQSDGRIVVAGSAGFSWLFARYDADGNLDPSFASGGVLVKQLGSTYETPFDLVVQADGKIVAAGYAGSSHGAYDFVLVRCNADGTLDDGSVNDTTIGDSFGDAGVVRTTIQVSNVAWSLAQQPDGKLVVAGRSGGLFQSDAYTIVRYQADGQLDMDFGIDGIVRTDLGGIEGANSLNLLPNGDILIGGNSTLGGTNEFAVLRYNSAGVLDTNFGIDGIATAGVPTPIYGIVSLAVQSDGKIIGFGTTNSDGTDSFGVVRFNADGSPDLSFGTSGLVITDFADGSDQAYKVQIQSDGRIVVAGYAETSPGNIDMAMARYLSGTVSPEIKIKPGSGDQAINLGSQGIIPVHVLGSPSFDVNDIALDSLRLEGAAPFDIRFEDVNGDGMLDLALKFRVQDTSLKTLYGSILAELDQLDDGQLDAGIATRQFAAVRLSGSLLNGDELTSTCLVELFLAGKPLREFLAQLDGI